MDSTSKYLLAFFVGITMLVILGVTVAVKAGAQFATACSAKQGSVVNTGRDGTNLCVGKDGRILGWQ